MSLKCEVQLLLDLYILKSMHCISNLVVCIWEMSINRSIRPAVANYVCFFIVVPTESSTSPETAPIQQFLDSIAGTKKGTVCVGLNYIQISPSFSSYISSNSFCFSV